jgi:hypothetical protein
MIGREYFMLLEAEAGQMNDVRAVHVTIAGSAAGNVRELIKEREFEQLLSVEDCFSIGPLFKIPEASGLLVRKNYLRKIFDKILQPTLYEEVCSHIGVADLRRLPVEAKQIIAWCGANADEQILLRAVCSFVADIPIKVIDISTMNSINKKRSAIGGSNLAELAQAEQSAVLLSGDVRKRLTAEWESIIGAQDLLRIHLDGQVKAVEETYFDMMLEDMCPRDFGSAARLVGKVMGQSQVQIGDTFLDYRLRELIDKGAIEARHEDKQLRCMKVRQASKDSFLENMPA